MYCMSRMKCGQCSLDILSEWLLREARGDTDDALIEKALRLAMGKDQQKAHIETPTYSY